jgi:hypothetical protein
MEIIELIQSLYGKYCQLCTPLTEQEYKNAVGTIPDELLEILKVSNGINEVMIHPKVDNGKPFVIGSVVLSLDGMKSETERYLDEHGSTGTVFCGDGAGGSFVLKPDGKVYLYDRYLAEEELYADSLQEFWKKWDSES